MTQTVVLDAAKDPGDAGQYEAADSLNIVVAYVIKTARF
jgi:hypothetical protein